MHPTVSQSVDSRRYGDDWWCEEPLILTVMDGLVIALRRTSLRLGHRKFELEEKGQNIVGLFFMRQQSYRV